MRYVSENVKELIETQAEACEEEIIDALADIQAMRDQMQAAFENYHAMRNLGLDVIPPTDRYKVRVDYSSINAMTANLTYCPYEEFPIKVQLENGYAKLKAKDNSLIIDVKPEYAYSLSEEIEIERVNMKIYGKTFQITNFAKNLKEFTQAISNIAQ